jgi:hypothetical protein
LGHALRSVSQIPVGITVDITLHPPGNNFGVAMMPLRMRKQGGDQQRLVLHQA